MSIISFTRGGIGQDGINPVTIKMVCTDSLAAVTTAGYLSANTNEVNQVYTTDVIEMIYDFSKTTGVGTFGIFTPIFNNGIITLALSANNVILPTVAGNFIAAANTTGTLEDSGVSASNAALPKVSSVSSATVGLIPHFTDTIGTLSSAAGNVSNLGNIAAGALGTAGILTSFPSAGATGSLSLQASANVGNYNNVITNASTAQPTTWTLADPSAAAAKIAQTTAVLVNGNLVKANGANGVLADVGARIIANTTAAYGGGGTSNTFAATGLTATCHGSCTIKTYTNPVSIVGAVVGTDTLAVTFSADPGPGTTVSYIYATAPLA